MGCLPAKSCKKMIEMLEKSWKSLVNAGNKSHHLTTSPSPHHTISAISAKSSTMASAPASMRLSRKPLPYVTPMVIQWALRPMRMSKWVSPTTTASSNISRYVAVHSAAFSLSIGSSTGNASTSGRPIVAAISSSLCCGRCMASKVRWKVLSITGFVSAMVPRSRESRFSSYCLCFIVMCCFL